MEWYQYHHVVPASAWDVFNAIKGKRKDKKRKMKNESNIQNDVEPSVMNAEHDHSPPRICRCPQHLRKQTYSPADQRW